MKIKTLFSAALLHTAFLFPTSYSWVVSNLTGNWSTPADWSPAGPPTLAGDVATFPTGGTGPITVTVDMPTFIIGTLSFTNTANAYTLTASSTNSLNLTGGAGAAAITNGSTVTSNNTISSALVLTNPLTITQSSTTNPLTISGVMSGAGSVTTAGTGTTVITGGNTYSGGTNVPVGQLNCNATGTLPTAGALTITGGTVQCGAINVLPATGTVTINSGTLNLNGSAQTTGPIAGTGGTITLGAVTLTSTTSTTTTYNGAINSVTGGGFTLAGSGGMLTLANSTGYNGTTTVSGSTLVLGPGVALSPGANLTVNGPGVINFGNTAQIVGVLSGTGNGSIILPALTPGLTNNGTALSTFAGVISGPGGFTQAGTFILTLTGVNTYTGPTTINAGATLQLGANNDIASSSTVAVSGTLDMTPAGSTQQTINSPTSNGVIKLGTTQLTINTPVNTLFAGSITTGAGSVILAGPMTLTLSGNSTYTGGTTVNGGILQLGIAGALPPSGNLQVNSPGTFDLNSFAQTVGLLSGNGSITTGTAAGILTVDPPAGMSSTFSGVISQAGQLVVGSTGTLILTGPNTYSGGTTVNANANLQGNSTSLQGAINNNGTLTFSQPSPGTFIGTLGGAGTLILNAGTLTIPGFTQGNTLVNAGKLILGSNAVVLSPISVAPGATLGLVNTAMATGNISVGGTFNLGLGTLTLLGSYTQSPGSTFDVELSSARSGFLPVIGPVTLTGSPAIDISFLPGTFAPSRLYTLITSTTPVAGTFAAPVFTNPFFQGTLIYNAVGVGSVQLLLQIAPFSNVITGGNAGALAKCINPQAFPAQSNILPIIDTLIFLPIQTVKSILDEIQPSQLKALGLTEENNLVVIRSSLSQHMDDLYKTDCNRDVSELYNYNIWSNFSGDFLRQEGQRENIGYSADTAGVTLGIDTAVGDHSFVGIAGAYDYTWLEWNHSRGHGSISSYYAGPYWAWFNRHLFIDTSILGTFNTYTASRHIHFPTSTMHARNSHNGQGLIAHFDLGVMMYPSDGMTVSPLVGIDYIHLWEKGYTERGAAGLDMKIFPTHASLFRTELGIEIAKCAVLTHNKWTHDLKLSWIHQFPLSGRDLHAKFADVKCTYTVQGLQPNQDYFDVATGLTGLFMNDKLSAALRYEGKFGDGIRDNTGYVQLTYRF